MVRNRTGLLSLLAGMLTLCTVGAAEEGLRFEAKRLSVDANEGIDIADVDGDGQLDIISGRNWYRAPEYVPHPLRLIEDWNGYVTSNGDFAYDVNGDGRPDVIAGGFLNTEIHWFENPGEEGLRLGQLWKKHVLVDTKLSQNEGNMFLDLNENGTPEFLVNSWNKTNPLCAWKLTLVDQTETIREKQGNETVEKTVTRRVPSLERWVIGQRANGHGMAVGDLNNDGRLDILTGEGWYEQPAKNSDTEPWIHRADWANLHAAVPCVVHDVNQDGKNDIIWAKGHDFGIYWWESKGQSADGSLEWVEHEVDMSYSQAHAMILADLDGDGQPELITGKRHRAHNGRDPGGQEPACVYYYKWDPKTVKFTRYPIDVSGKVGIGLQIRVADLNADSLVDVAVAGKSGTYVLFNRGKK
ncbi:MAG: VCBS repeat-containing protein [Planctomycetaceae bacterium]|nr:VCBS repeat-containing protein [Planctomycetaceae bacterium]